MTKPLKLIAANDTFGALLAFTDVLDGKLAVFITPPEVNGKMPETFGLPDEVADDVALIVESSGSTGTPKRIEISREALLNSANASALALGSIEASSQWLLALPINFIAGANVLIRSVLAGNQPVMMNTAVGFTAEAFVRHASMMTGDKKFTALVPTQLSRLAIAAEHDASVLNAMNKFNAILVGGQATAPQLLDSLREQGVNVIETYGSAETFGGVVYDGVALDGYDVSLTADSRIEISSAELGTVVMSDLGEINDGKLRVLGRADRVIISGGIKISLDRVEAIAGDVAGVVEMAATAISDSEWGERVGIVYLGSPEVADEIATRLADELGPAAKPLRVIRADRVPRLSSGKNDLLAIKQLFEKSQSGE